MTKTPQDLTITSLDTLTAFDPVTGDYVFTLDEPQKASIEQSEEKTDITGKQGRKLSSLKKNKGVKITGTNGMISGGLLETQTGGKFESKNTTVMWSDYTTIKTNAAATKYKAHGTTGAEIEALYVKDTDGSIKEVLTQDTAVGEGKFTYDPATKALAFKESAYADGTEIVVYYSRRIKAAVLENSTDKYSKKLTLYVDCTAEDKCSNIYHTQLYIPKADFSGEFSLELGEDQTVHSFDAEALAGGGCRGTDINAFWTYTVFGANAEDVTGD